MPSEFKRIHYIAGGAAFLVGFITYFLTMQPTIPFWDCGEFAAAASALQIPHPPGAPLWTLVGRIAMLLPTFTDVAARYNLFSVIASALSILLLYLILVHLIRYWRGPAKTNSDAIIMFGGALIGALSYCWTDSFWFNALECEVYAFGSLFISLALWLVFVWADHADEPHHERYLLLIAYVIGLSLGVHQLALLTMFPAFMIVYMTHWKSVTEGQWGKSIMLSILAIAAAGFIILESPASIQIYEWILAGAGAAYYSYRAFAKQRGWNTMVLLSVVAFGFTFVVILSKLVEWAGHGLGIISIFVLALIVAAIIYSQIAKKPAIAMSGWMLMMVFLGYTTYMFVMVRATQNPPMNENAPSSFAKLAGYINRDQYGSMSLGDEFAHRRLPGQKGDHPATWDDYASDGQFFWQYQTNEMFHRYLGWNFIGRTDDYKGAGVDFSKTWALPFILGLFGIYWQFKKDPKRGLVLLGTFIIMGYLVDWYQNQQDPQPRERDYFYVGAFYIYSMWVGIGAVGIMELIKERYHAWQEQKLAKWLAGAFVLLFLFGPLNQCIGVAGLLQGQPFSKSSKWAEYSRKHNWVPWEYAYNILQSCEPNAILFTYGDNDTFPLWALQDSYGIRRDVRIVQLQLATMMWNVKQLKTDNDWGGKAIKLTNYTNAIVNMSDNDAYRLLDWTPKPLDMPISAETARWITGDSTAPATVFNWTPKFILPSDQVVLDIIKNNLATRPICYSATVPEDSRAGLNKYLIYEGMIARVTPFEQPADNNGLGGSVQPTRYAEVVFHYPKHAHAEPNRGMILHSYSDPEAHTSAMDNEYSLSYRYEFMRLANYYIEHGNLANARHSLDTMEARIPSARIPLDYSFASFIADLADKSGDWPLVRV
ncbi:MAG: protein O-mannosyl-transferase family, partial [Candidatus Kapaibacterium sp.]